MSFESNSLPAWLLGSLSPGSTGSDFSYDEPDRHPNAIPSENAACSPPRASENGDAKDYREPDFVDPRDEEDPDYEVSDERSNESDSPAPPPVKKRQKKSRECKGKGKGKLNPVKFRQCSPDGSGEEPFTYVTTTNQATPLYEVLSVCGKPSGAFSISKHSCTQPGTTEGVPLVIRIELKPKNHMHRKPLYPCLGCGASFMASVEKDVSAHPCVMSGVGVPEIYGHLCGKCYKLQSRGYYCALIDDVVVLTAFTETMRKKWKESCKKANQQEKNVTNPFYVFDDHHITWFELTAQAELKYIGARTLAVDTKLFCIHGPKAMRVSQQYITAFPPRKAFAVRCDGQNFIMRSEAPDAVPDISSFTKHLFAQSSVSTHGPFPNVRITKNGVVVAASTIRTNDIISADFGFASFWPSVHGHQMPSSSEKISLDDPVFAGMAAAVTTLFPNDVTQLEPHQFMKWLAARLSPAIWNQDVRNLLNPDATGLVEFLRDAQNVLSDEQYLGICALLPADFVKKL